MSAPITTPLNWNRPPEDGLREAYARRIALVRSLHIHKPLIDQWLAMGAACPAVTKAERKLWIEEIHRADGEEG